MLHREMAFDVEAGVGQIDLSAIGPVLQTAGNQARTAIRTAAFSGTQVIVEGRVDNDTLVDFQIRLTNVTELSVFDIIL